MRTSGEPVTDSAPLIVAARQAAVYECRNLLKSWARKLVQLLTHHTDADAAERISALIIKCDKDWFLSDEAGILAGTWYKTGKGFPWEGWDTLLSKTAEILEVLHTIIPKFVTEADIATMRDMIKECRMHEKVANDINWEACKILLVDGCLSKFLTALHIWRLSQDQHGAPGPLLANFLRLKAPAGSIGTVALAEGTEQLALTYELFRQGHVFSLAAAELPSHATRVERPGKAKRSSTGTKGTDAAGSDNAGDVPSDELSGLHPNHKPFTYAHCSTINDVRKQCRIPAPCPSHVGHLLFDWAKCSPSCSHGKHPNNLMAAHKSKFIAALPGFSKRKSGGGGRGRGGGRKRGKLATSTTSSDAST